MRARQARGFSRTCSHHKSAPVVVVVDGSLPKNTHGSLTWPQSNGFYKRDYDAMLIWTLMMLAGSMTMMFLLTNVANGVAAGGPGLFSATPLIDPTAAAVNTAAAGRV